jgi:hypothetical protein
MNATGTVDWPPREKAREKGMALEAEFARAGLFLARVGAVTDGSGVALA